MWRWSRAVAVKSVFTIQVVVGAYSVKSAGFDDSPWQLPIRKWMGSDTGTSEGNKTRNLNKVNAPTERSATLP